MASVGRTSGSTLVDERSNAPRRGVWEHRGQIVRICGHLVRTTGCRVSTLPQGGQLVRTCGQRVWAVGHLVNTTGRRVSSLPQAGHSVDF
jgi:hypothetical protein